MHQQLLRGLPDALESQRDTLALIMVGISQSMFAHIGNIARAMSDWQREGFHLDQMGIEEGEHVERLLIPLASVYLWLVALGRWLVKRGDRELIDDGPHGGGSIVCFSQVLFWCCVPAKLVHNTRKNNFSET